MTKYTVAKIAFCFRVRFIVKDPVTAETPCRRTQRIGTKRICVDTDHYATYNRPNVSLMDLRKTPVTSIEPEGCG